MSRRQATEAATRAFVDRGYSNDQYTSGSQTFGQGAVNKVVLEDVGENKIQVIAAVRSFLNCGLKEAKDLVDAAPSVIKENAPAEEAQKFKEELEGLEATVRLE
ncbi:MAG: ribosomal protein L7/L12 [Clostridiaceae bacterium]|nr:ribosomal protein L7/L12 [Clostridiaceae bacterium]